MTTGLANQLTSLREGQLVSLVLKKKGTKRGRGAAKKTYGNDVIHVFLYSGFEYKALAKVSLDVLDKLESSGTLLTSLKSELQVQGHSVDGSTLMAAISEVRDSLSKAGTLAPRTNVQTLSVNGEKVPGCSLYIGPGPDPAPGTIYITGYKIGERVLTPSPNGSWKTQSQEKTLAKKLLRKRLPIGHFVSYRLEPGSGYQLRIGDAATDAAKADDITLGPELLLDLLQLQKAA